MSKTQDALKLALESIEDGETGHAAQILREALAEQPAQEPVALDPKDVHVEVVTKQMGGFAPVMTNGIRLTHKPTGIVVEETAERSAHRNRHVAWERLAQSVASPQPAQPAQQQEPFAYAYTGIKHNGEHHGPHLVWKPAYMDAMSASMGAVAVPLYTRPQPADEPFMWVCNSLGEDEWETSKQQECEHCIPVYTRPRPAAPDRVHECAKRLVDHADFQLGGILSADSKARDIPSNAVSQVKARHLAALRDALAAMPKQEGGDA